jgi:hypothetical protein
MSKSDLNIGHFSKLKYDEQAYADHLDESVQPLNYILNTNYMQNCNQCLSTLGPRSSYMGQSVSSHVGFPTATSQKLVDVESILQNRNVKASKARRDNVNPINVTKYGVKHQRICNDYLNPLSSRLTLPASNYRDMAINRFYNLNRNPQVNVFYDFSVNTKLEAKDNFIQEIPVLWNNDISPKPTSQNFRYTPRCKFNMM